MTTDTSLITFKAITNFTMALGDMFKNEQRTLALYCRLIEQTTLAHEKAIKNHIEAFYKFCKGNRDALVSRDKETLEEKRIYYSKKVFIDMEKIFSLADKDTEDVIWDHLLTISALVDPAGKAKKALEEQKNSGKATDEADFLTNIIGKVDQHVDPNGNPMDAVSSIMKSGVFTDLVQGMTAGLENGSLDLGKLMGTVNTLVTSAGEQSGDQKNGEDAMNMINGMMGSIMKDNNINKKDEVPVPDLAGMLGPMLGALSGQNSQGGMPDLSKMIGSAIPQESGVTKNAIETKIDAEVAKAKQEGKL